MDRPLAVQKCTCKSDTAKAYRIYKDKQQGRLPSTFSLTSLSTKSKNPQLQKKTKSKKNYENYAPALDKDT